MINRKLKFLAIVLLSITIIIPAELTTLVSSTPDGSMYINSTTTSTPGQQVILGSEVDLYLGNMSVSASMVHLVISQNPTVQFTAGDRIYSPSLATSFLWSSIGTTVTNTSNGWWTIQSNWINGTIPRDIPTGNYYIKLMDSDTGQIIAVTDTYITAAVSGYLQLYPSSGIGGVDVQFTGSSFEPNQPVDISYYDQTLKTWVYWETQTANASGVFVFSKEIPDLGASLSTGDNAEATKPISFKAYGNGTIAFADYYQYLRGLKKVDDQTATGLYGNNTYLSQVQVKVGENVSISGKYFHPQDTIYIRWDGIQEVGTVTGEQWLNAQIVGTSLTNTTGGFNAQFTVPLCSIGAHYIAIQDSQTKLIVQIYVMNSTTLNISPYSGPGGIPVQLTGISFPVGANINIMYLDTQQSYSNNTWNYLANVTANSSGQIYYSFEMPDLGRSVGQGNWYEGSTYSLMFRAQINDIIYSQTEYLQNLRGLKTVGSYTADGLIGNGTSLVDSVRVIPEDQITISGRWFHPQDVIYVRWDGTGIYGTVTGSEWNNAQILSTSIANSTGGFTTQITIPDAAIGEHYISIEDSNARVIIKIFLSPGTVSITPDSGPGGNLVTIMGEGFPASTSVTLEYLNPETLTWNYWMTNSSEPSGRVYFNAEIPDVGRCVYSGDSSETSTTSTYRLTVNDFVYGTVNYNQYNRGLKIVGSQTAYGLYGNGTDFTSTVLIKTGDSLRISGNYFHPGVVYLRWDGQSVVGTVTANQWSQTTPMGTIIANSAGYFDTTMTIPGADQGKHFISIEDSQTRLIITVWVTQTSQPTPTPTPSTTPQPTQSPAPTQTPQPTATPTPTPNPNKPTPTINVQCKSTATDNGFKVMIKGLLSSNGTALSSKTVQLSYSKDGGINWESLTQVNTGSDGKFNAVWISSASGVFMLKAESAASTEYNQASVTVNFAIEPENTGENVFTMLSNSTISQLSFDSETSELSFIASGETGTKGYTTISIPKTLISDISNLKVYLDNNEVTFTSSLDQDTWFVTISYPHSTHNIVMSLSGTQNQPNQQTPWTIIGAGVAIAIIATVVIVVVLKKRQPTAKIDKI